MAVQQWREQGFLIFWHSWSLRHLHVTGHTGQAHSGCLLQQPLRHDGAHTLPGLKLCRHSGAGVSAGSCRADLTAAVDSTCRAAADSRLPSRSGSPVSVLDQGCSPVLSGLLCTHWSNWLQLPLFYPMHSNVSCRQQLPRLTE